MELVSTVLARDKLISEGKREQILLLHSQGLSKVKMARDMKCLKNALQQQ